jgi:doublesex- and mab-3-related transcription factor 4/5
VLIENNQQFSISYSVSSSASSFMKSAFSPLIPPAFASAGRYPFLQHQAKRFLSAPYAGTGYLPTVLEPDQNDVNGNSNAGDSQD